MKQMRFSIEIEAGKQIVWHTLWQDESLRQWAGIIDAGTYMVGELAEGHEVQFISGNGYGVTSLVAQLIPNEFVLLKHRADTQSSGEQTREDQWTGGEESYSLNETASITTLTVAFDVPPELETYFQTTYPKALELIKTLAEKNR